MVKIYQFWRVLDLTYDKRGHIRHTHPTDVKIEQYISPLCSLVTNIAQSIMRKRVFGYSPPIISMLSLHGMSEFESMSILGLAKSICSGANVKIIGLFNSFKCS